MSEPPDSARIDVLHLSWSGRVGGIERMLESVLHEARARGGLRHAAGFLDGEGPIGEALEREGLAWRLGMRRGADPRGLWRLRRRLREQRPRILHLHTVALGAATVALRTVEGGVAYTEHFPRLLERPRSLRRLYRLLRGRQAMAIGLSPGLARQMAACGLSPDRIQVVPNPCRVGIRETPRRREDPPMIGVVCRLVRPARVDLLIEIVARVRSEGTACRLLVVGDGPEREVLERLAARLLGPGVAEFAGEHDDVASWLDRMELFVLTRPFPVYPLALIEAMARGVPVVAMHCGGGAAEIVEAAGKLLPDREIATAATAVAGLLLSEAERERLAERGRRLAAEHRPATVLDRLEAVYAALGVAHRAPGAGGEATR